MTPSGIARGEQSVWQRRAAGELAVILRAHRDLPAVAWTVGPAGCVLLGQVGGLASDAETRAVFDTWRAALVLEEDGPRAAAGVVHLRAVARRNRVWVRLSAAVFDAEGGPR